MSVRTPFSIPFVLPCMYITYVAGKDVHTYTNTHTQTHRGCLSSSGAWGLSFLDICSTKSILKSAYPIPEKQNNRRNLTEVL